VNFVAGESADHYGVRAADGDTLVITTVTPGGGGAEPANALDPRVELFDPAGTLVASDDNGGADGRNARIEYVVPAGAAGTYRAVAARGRMPCAWPGTRERSRPSS
jgi:hypothetical protein